MSNDLLKHIGTLEAFRARPEAKSGAQGLLHDWEVLPDEEEDDEARAYLERVGALVATTGPREGGREISRHTPRPGMRFHSVQEESLEETFCRLPSLEALMALLEEGVECGALTVFEDRVIVNVESHEGVSKALAYHAQYEITSVVRRAAAALKAREAAPLLQRMSGSDRAGAVPPGALPALVQLRSQKGHPQPVLKQGPRDSATGVRRKIREFFASHPVIASAEEVGPDTVLMVRGDPIRLSDGTYLPVEAVEEEARAGLEALIEQRGSGLGRGMMARVDDLEPAPIPDPYLPTLKVDEALDESDIPSPERIELAYRLLKGIQLSSDQGEALDVSTRARFERLLGHGFSNVKLHTGPAAKWITESLSARAVTAGEHVFVPEERLGEGSRGQQTLAHELTHVKQFETTGEARPRLEIEAEARAMEQQIDELSEMTLPGKVVPDAPVPGRLEAAGVFMAQPVKETTPSGGEGGTKKLDLRNEEILEQLEERIRDSVAREKEEARDRVF